MTDIKAAAAFAARLYRQQADVAYAGYVRRDPMALLKLRPGRDNPYAIYERLRRDGTVVWTTPTGHTYTRPRQLAAVPRLVHHDCATARAASPVVA